jgi:hypothetical protein
MGGRGSGGRNVLSDAEKIRRGTYRPCRSEAARAGLKPRRSNRGRREEAPPSVGRPQWRPGDAGPQPFGTPTGWKDPRGSK